MKLARLRKEQLIIEIIGGVTNLQLQCLLVSNVLFMSGTILFLYKGHVKDKTVDNSINKNVLYKGHLKDIFLAVLF